MSNTQNYGNFPDPFAQQEAKLSLEYGLKYAKGIEGQWGSSEDSSSLFSRRMVEFETNRDYAYGRQDTSIYKQILNSMNPDSADGTLLNLDWTPVPIVPKFVKVVVNRILSRKPYPNIEAIDPLSRDEKEESKAKIEVAIENKATFQDAKALGLQTEIDPDILPDSTEEAEIFEGQNIKTSAEISAQLGIALTLEWNDFDQAIYRRNVEDLTNLGMAVVKRSNDPNYGIVTKYVDPSMFLHSFTEDPNMADIVYAGHVERISIQELKRRAGEEIKEEQYEKLAKQVQGKWGNNAANFNLKKYDQTAGRYWFGYDDFLVDVLDFEFVSIDKVYYEKKQSRFGNVGYYYKGGEYIEKPNSIYAREPHCMTVTTIYGGTYVLDSNLIFDYGIKKNIPRNIHDITRARMSYSAVCTNLRRMMPKSMVGSIKGFADQLQLIHLKIQQAVAKSKPDGLVIDIEGLENVQLGKGGELQPLQIQDIYEQSGIFYYRSKNPEGGHQNPPIREISNSIRNIEQLVGLYNHYLNMIRDATGINEAIDASTPKGEALVGVQQQAIAAGNNALYDITNASIVLFRRVCEDIVKCLQIIPVNSVLYSVYEKAIGKYNMQVLSSFKDLPMYNFGVQVVQEMSVEDKLVLENNIQQSLAQKELDLEDALAIRQLKDIDQAQRLLMIRRKRRMATRQQEAMQMLQAQSQAQAQGAAAINQSKAQLAQIEAQLEIEKMKAKAQLEVAVANKLQPLKKEIEMIKVSGYLGAKSTEQEFKERLDVLKEDRKDDRVEKQASLQSQMIEQRNGKGSPLPPPEKKDDLISTIIDG